MSDHYQTTLDWARRLSPSEQLSLIAELTESLRASVSQHLGKADLEAEAQRILQERRNSLSQGKGEELPQEGLREQWP